MDITSPSTDATWSARRSRESATESGERPAIIRKCWICQGDYTLAELLPNDMCRECGRIDALLERKF